MLNRFEALPLFGAEMAEDTRKPQASCGGQQTPETPGAGDAARPRPTSGPIPKKKPEDFIFGKVIGEGSYSTVFLAKEVNSGKEYAIKVLDKRHIMREKKSQYVHREKEVFSRINHPFFVKLAFTFQDKDRLYFGLSYAKNGELLNYINKLGCFDENCTRFYAGELVLALEHLHSLGIVHRDLKPENVLLNEDMHIQVTDFGSAKILGHQDPNPSQNSQPGARRNSFVGTAQYVSPEILTSKVASSSSDLWGLGCIIYQLLSGQLPFWGGNEYQIFQKIMKLEYEFPSGFNAQAEDLVRKLLVIDPEQRLGSEQTGGFAALKAHPFFQDIDWDTLHLAKAPELLPFLPKTGDDSEDLWGQYKAGLTDQHLSRLIGIDFKESSTSDVSSTTTTTTTTTTSSSSSTETEKGRPSKSKWPSDEERRLGLEIQARDNAYHRFVEGNFILKQGLVDKRKGLFARRRMLLLTEGPHLYYVDPQNMVLKGEIPWSDDLRTEAKNFKIYFVHTPNRTYYLEDPDGNALKWCKKIDEVWQHYYGDKENKT